MRTGRTIVSLAALLAVLATSGCASAGKARDSAELLAAYTQRVKKDAERFAESREALAKARQATINRLEQATIRLEANSTEYYPEIWRIAGDQDRLRLYKELRDAANTFAKRAAEAKEFEARRASELTKLLAGTKVRSKELTETAKTLASLSEKRKPKEDLAFLIAFGKEVRDEIRKAEEAGEEEAQEGQKAAESKEAGVEDGT